MHIPARVVARAMANVHRSGDCLISNYSTGSHGYAQIGWHHDRCRRVTLVHRVVWFARHGPIPEGMTIDHICRIRRCVNVDHLRLLSNVDNARDNGHARRTQCPKGHPYDEVNTYVDPKGHRRCRRCCAELNAGRKR
jgi:HNH endonuclease